MKKVVPSRRTDGSHRVRGFEPGNRLWALLAILALSACDEPGADPGSGLSVQDSAGIEIVENHAPEDGSAEVTDAKEPRSCSF